MGIFRNIEPHHGERSIVGAARMLAAVLANLPSPRSLCEVRCDDDDYRWLVNWAERLSARTAKEWLTPYGRSEPIDAVISMREVEALGALLLLTAAETARREAREGEVWSVFLKKFSDETQRILFVQGQPNQSHKDALEAAVERLQLRNVFGVEGTQNYYVTVYLQFGFTQNAIQRLAMWLAGQGQSEAVEHLLSTDGHLMSASFKQLWHALHGYRRHNVTRERTRALLLNSPWVRPDWADAILEQASRQIDRAGGGLPDVAFEAIPFLSQPRLRWTSNPEPSFECQLTNLALLDLSAAHYDVLRGGERLATLLRQPDESYTSFAPIELPPDLPEYLLTLVDDEGGTVAQQIIELWDPNEEVTVYDVTTGVRIADAWHEPVSPNRAYALITSADLTLEPEPTRWSMSGDATRRLSLLTPGWVRSLSVHLAGAEFWQPNLDTRRSEPTPDPDWVRNVLVSVKLSYVRIGELIEPEIEEIPEDAELEFVRFHGGAVDFSQFGTKASVPAFYLTPQMMAGKLTFTLGLRKANDRVRVERALDLDGVGTVRFTARGWEAIAPEDTLSVQDAETLSYRVYPPDYYEVPTRFDRLALLEGHTFSRRLWKTAQPIGRLAGLGAELYVTDSPYNSSKKLLPLARAVVSPGIVSGVEWGDGTARIHPRMPDLEPGPHHQVMVWRFGSTPILVPGEEIRAGPKGTWEISINNVNDQACALAVAYDGAWLGAWWCPCLRGSWPVAFDTTHGAREAAALLHWFRLPLLQAEYKSVIVEFASRYTPQVMRAWLLDEGLPANLQPGLSDEEWLGAVRTLLWDWDPTPDQAQEVIASLASSVVEDPIAPLGLLLRLNPLLLRRVIRSLPRSYRLPGSQQILARDLERLRRAVAGLGESAADHEVQQRQKFMLQETAVSMRLDDVFVERGIVTRALHPRGQIQLIDVANLRTAMAIRTFREYLGLRVLAAP